MDYQKVARDIVDGVGGASNIAMAEHCMTRLRLNLKDDSAADRKQVEAIPGVLGVVEKGGQFQVVIGGEVPNVYAALDKLASTSEGQTAPKATGNLFSRMLDTLAGVFVPLLPAIIGAGMVKALLSTLTIAGLVDAKSTTFILLNAVSDGAFFFLPILVAFSAAKKFGMNQFVASAIALGVLHPSVAALMTASTTNGTPISFFGLPVSPATYSSSVIAMFFTIWLASYIDRFFNRVVPASIRVVFAPMLTILVVVTAFFVAIGPVGSIAGKYLAQGVVYAFENAGPLAGFALGAGWPLLVMVGMHYALVPVIVESIANQGYDYILVAGTMANLAQGAAALAVFFRLRNKAMRPITLSAAIPAFFGVTEPAIYGVNLRYKRPFVAGLIGGGVGGAVALIFQTKAYIYIKTGIQGLPMFIGPTFIFAVLSMVVAVAVAFTVAYLWGIKEDDVAVEADAGLLPNTETAVGGPYALVVAPVAGTVVPLASVPDAAFSTGVVGAGVAIEPSSGQIVSPLEGTVIAIFPTNHAIGLRAEDGTEVLIHVGLDTVRLKGQHFEGLVARGDRVSVGTPLIRVDLEAVKKAGYSTLTPVIATQRGATIEAAHTDQTVVAGEPLFTIHARTSVTA